MKQLSLVAFDLPDGPELLSWLAPRLGPKLAVTPAHFGRSVDVSSSFVQVRGQYDAGRILGRLTEHVQSDFVLAVTAADLFMPVFTFVLGEAELSGKSAVVSIFRLQEERYGLPPDPTLLLARLLKEAVHELGHCRGLTHCRNSSCVMYASSSVEDVDLKSEDFCSRCRPKLR